MDDWVNGWMDDELVCLGSIDIDILIDDCYKLQSQMM